MERIWNNYRIESRKQWASKTEQGEIISDEHIKLGCALRIADSLESIDKSLKIIASRKAELDKQIQSLLSIQKGSEIAQEYLCRRIAALKGVITRMKKHG